MPTADIETTDRDETTRRKNRTLGLVVGGVIVGMIGFCVALIPLYNLLCKAGGVPTLRSDVRSSAAAAELAGKTAGAAIPGGAAAGASSGARAGHRTVMVRWWAVADDGVPVNVVPETPAVETPIGGRRQVMFRFTNLSDRTVSFQAIHSTVPEVAEAHVDRLVCFCFTRQSLEPHQTRELPVLYTVDAGLPAGIDEINVGYSLFPLKSPSRQG